ncbi:unnamed protein product [Arabidopsis lyrata]|uniref:Low-molecular-weight cysteine-rich 84 n=3 Tax=Arabidopsis TaxID=3701 RepID=D7LDF0_ARALL|nr:defensin-like protein 71 [Arabidopsis lyrata subsp. lyrata]EFH54870.1 low-molecular-weight cysteine-rich 84 [Arabidopsis lyrata subsp. lyrata]KAG7567275.1 hypothetical protein ISN45_Aa04g001600 [Arabidopsis thaliana x Arabidopsis arenosa]KAG7571736.1 hypothetical protein ISN44_As09g001520 [Arabidopsis suecica]CAH8263098.1 unnamed protein product [Arabidopsis lyrata]|eukprot:XP_002878611.1 defensin-like protein 71 [Arabidopsis lyrata subsp. lyrata]
MTMTKAFVIFILVATSLCNSNALPSSVVNGFGYDYCIAKCSITFLDDVCKPVCISKGYSDGGCIGGPKLKCCCKK